MIDFDVPSPRPTSCPRSASSARVLGPRGLMPNPKTGTVTHDVAKAVSDFKGGKVEYRTDRRATMHVPLGKASFTVDALATNFTRVVDELERGQARPSAKGRYFRSPPSPRRWVRA